MRWYAHGGQPLRKALAWGIRPVAMLIGVVSVLAVAPAAALAKETHILLSTFPAPPGLGLIHGLAIDESDGDVWVADARDGIIDHFSALGEPLSPQINCSDTPQASCEEGPLSALSVDPSDSNLYATEFRQGVIDEFESSGTYVSQISEANIPEGEPGSITGGAPFAPYGVVVDPATSELFVGDIDNDVIDVFNKDGKYERHFQVGNLVSSIAIDSRGNLFAGTVAGVEVYEAASGLLEGVLEESRVAIDAQVAVEPGSNDVYVAHGNTNQEVKEYDPWEGRSGLLLAKFTSGAYSDGIGIGLNRDVYVAGEHNVSIFGPLVAAAEPTTSPATEATTESAVLNGVVNPNGLPVEQCYFEYGTTEAYGQEAKCEPEANVLPTPEGEDHVSARITIQPNTAYHFRLVAANQNAKLEGSDKTISVPIVEADAVHTVTGEGKLSVFGVVNPDESETSYNFEFVTEQQYDEGDWAAAISTPASQLKAANGGELVTEGIPELRPGATYRFRLSAKSEAYPEAREHSLVKTFAVPASEPEGVQPACPNEAERTGPSSYLPDCRAYEQVTPTDKEGAQDNFDYGKGDDEVVIGLDGERVLMTTLSKWGQNVSGQSATTYSFARTPEKWEMSSLSPQPQTDGVLNEPYGFFTPDLSQILLARDWATSVNAASPEVEFALGRPGGPYTKVASEPQEHFTAPSPEHGEEEVRHEGHWVAQSRDGSVAVIESPDHKLIEGYTTGTTAPIAVNGGQGNQGYDLYEYAEGHLHQVNVTSKSEGERTIGTCGAELAEGREGGGIRGLGQGRENATISLETGSVNAISADGSRIFFEAFPDGCPTSEEETQRKHGAGGPKIDLYMRVDGERTVEIGNYTFEGANPEGTKLLLSRQEEGGLEFFSYDIETATTKPLFSLGGSGFGAKHLLSENGQVFYFETTAVLSPEAPPAGTKIYRYDIATETMTFVAASSQSEGNGSGGLYVSPEGGDFYFNVNSVQGVSGSGGHVVEAYRYDSAEDVVQCVSCASPYDPEPQQLSTFMPEDGPIISRLAPLGSPASANGDFVLFDTPAVLLPQDINGEISPEEYNSLNRYFSPSSDVYEWRRKGIDGCGRVQGCLALITDGIDGTQNVLLGTDPSGQDVFIATHSQLASMDKDVSGDVYDARIGGGPPPPPPPKTECEGDACSVPPIAPFDPPQLLLAPPAVAGGVGSVVQSRSTVKPKSAKCGKGRKLDRGKCVKTGARKKTRKGSAGVRGVHSSGRGVR